MLTEANTVIEGSGLGSQSMSNEPSTPSIISSATHAKGMIEVDLEGIVNSLQLKEPRAVVPVLECIVNSIQSIQYGDAEERIDPETVSERSTEGHVTVTVDGPHQMKAPVGEGYTVKPQTIVIKDDGPGFRHIDFESFNRIGTQRKAKLGCKGIGRTSWLRVFRETHVDSVYRNGDGTLGRREFDFSLPDGITNHSEGEVPQDTKVSTTVTLNGFREGFDNFPSKADTLARQIFMHCISFFLSGKCPTITVKIGEDSVVVNSLYGELDQHVVRRDEEFDGFPLTLTHVRFFKGSSKEYSGISYCGNGLEVLSGNEFKEEEFTTEDGIPFKYRCFVYSPLLDRHVNLGRSDFDLPKKNRTLENPNEPPMDDIMEFVESKCREYLEPYRAVFLDKCKARLRQFIEDSDYSFSAAMKYDPELPGRIRPDMSNERILEICNESQTKLTAQLLYHPEKKPTRRGVDDSEAVRETLDKIGLLQKDNLASCIIHRKLMIAAYRNRQDAIRKEIGDKTKAKFELEALLHDIVLPRGTDPKHKPSFSSNNLWMFDERIYHYSHIGAYSNKAMSDIVQNGTDDCPDIVVFGEKADNDTLRTVAIIEMKRPMRGDLDVVEQVYKYIDQMKSGQAKDLDNRHFNINSQTIFHCYIVCDTHSESFRARMKMYGATALFGGLGYVIWNGNYNSDIMVIDHLELVADADRRNREFFKLLELDLGKDDVDVERVGDHPTVTLLNKD